ncbi:MAG: tetratricopeptide repeat protein [Candidatus Methylumidiphilus sp.]
MKNIQTIHRYALVRARVLLIATTMLLASGWVGAQQQMNQITPEQHKMMEKMGIVLPDLKNMPGASGNAGILVSQAMAGGFSTVPAKDAARIASIASQPLTEASMTAYLDATHRQVSTRITPDAKKLGDKVFDKLKSDQQPSASIGNSATGLWAIGRVQVAIYLMGRALAAEPSNTDNQSNYAAMLAMNGGEPLAIPVLDKLDRQFPGNTTVLNNLGQAWFNLGDLEKADKFLNDVIRIYAFHPQANSTQSFIEENRGNKDKAVELAKNAVRHSLSLDKENRLRKLGYKLTANDVRPLAKPEPDPLGLANFKHPAFPKTGAEEMTVRAEWLAFREEVQARMQAIDDKKRALKPMDKAVEQAMAAQKFWTDPAGANANKAEQALVETMPFARRARLKLQELDKDAGAKFRINKAAGDLKAYQKSMGTKHAAYVKAWQAEIGKAAYNGGERSVAKDACPPMNSLADQFLAANGEYEQLFGGYLQQLRLQLSQELYWKQFIQSPDDFANTKLTYQGRWLAALGSAYFYEVNTSKDCFSELPDQRKGSKLANFNDIHCPYHSEIDFAGVASIKSDCDKTTTKIGIGWLALGLKQDLDNNRNTFADQFVSCTVEVTAGKSSDVKLGPLSVGVGASATLGMEIGRSGIQDVYLTGQVGAGVSTNAMGAMSDAGHPASMGGIGVSDKTVIGVSSGGRISLVSGKGSADGVGVNFLK